MNLVFIGDAVENLKRIPSQSIQTCITSPPYFGLRDYGHAGQIGLEQTPAEYVARMVELFREVWRVLRDDGTLWLNLGDSYAGSGKGAWNIDDAEKKRRGVKETYRPNSNPVKAVTGLKNKELIGIPWRVALALQADGWYLRQDIIWSKPNPMPESVTDRCTKSHEYIFLLSKSAKYYYDAEAIKEPAIYNTASGHKERKKEDYKGNWADVTKFRGGAFKAIRETKNKRSVWTVSPKPYRGAHFATFPPALIEPCVLAGAPVGGVVLDPFGGSGTTGAVARQHGRKSILIELNPNYLPLINERLIGVI